MNLGGTIRVNKTGFIIVVLLLLLLVYYYTSTNDTTKLSDKKGISLRTMLSYAIKACKIGGIEVVLAKNNLVIKNKGKTKEGALDRYTTGDINSHCSMTKLIQKQFPNVHLISEEHTDHCDKQLHFDKADFNDAFEFSDELVEEKDVTVWIDPLDATQEYTEQLYQYVTTMACVAIKGKPTIGVIHNPFTNDTYWAWVNKGKSENLPNLKDVDHEETIVLISRSHAGKMQDVIKKNYSNDKMKIVEAGGAGYKVLQVATGKADVYLHITDIKKWDICAGDAILAALGGKLSTKLDAKIDYSNSDPVNKDGVIASFKQHDKFVGRI